MLNSLGLYSILLTEISLNPLIPVEPNKSSSDKQVLPVFLMSEHFYSEGKWQFLPAVLDVFVKPQRL